MILFHTLPLAEYLNQLMANGFILPMNLIQYTLFGMQQFGEVLHISPDDAYIPTEYIINDTESNFDYYFWKQIQEDPKCMMEKLKILEPEYLDGARTIILVQIDFSNQFKISITESLIGYLKTFYGVDPKLIMSYEDIQEDTFHYSGFSPEGLYRLTKELEFKYKGGG